jgi:lipopolysaccharide/colanic/teichoic acid biosynthesis glycosyltransferase
VPLLAPHVDAVLLAGRDPARIARLHPGFECTSFEEMETRAAGFDAVLHLAAHNNDQPGTLEDFREANVRLTAAVVDTMRKAGIGKLVFVSSIHAAENRSDFYSQTKREAEDYLQTVADPVCVILRLASVYDEDGEMGIRARTRRLPAPVRSLAFNALRALRPTVGILRVRDSILAALRRPDADLQTVTDMQSGNAVYAGVRRMLDWGFALAVIVLLWWLLLAVYAAVRLSSAGPGIFAQQRVGLGGRPFTCYKFRTMHVGTRQAGTHEVATSAVTSVGRFLRASKIDELPQVVNLLRGDMSLVGPRPCLPNQHELVAERHRRGVFDVLPGITGLAQVQGIDMSDPARLARKDEDYIARRTLPLDLKILLKTALR